MTTTEIALPRLLATTVVRGQPAGRSSGGVFLLDFAQQDVTRVLDWSHAADGSSSAGDGSAGLRGIACSDSELFVAASEELLLFGPDFRLRQSFRSAYLRGCSEIFLRGRNLFLACSGNDCVLAFDLERQQFSWALHIALDGDAARGTPFDPGSIGGPGGADGPPARNRLGLNSVHANPRGLFVSGLHTRGLLRVDSERKVQRLVEMPEGIHNAQPFGDGVVFNDTAAGVVRFVSRDGGQQVFPVPTFDAEGQVLTGGSPAAGVGLARGLCAIDELRVAGGASPAVVTLYDLASGSTIGSVDFSSDPAETIHSLAIWPFDPEAADAERH